MLITELLRGHSFLAMQREATRLLQNILESLDITPAPDGTVRFAFKGDVEFLDRLAVWGASVEDDEDFADQEPDARDLAKVEGFIFEASERCCAEIPTRNGLAAQGIEGLGVDGLGPSLT